LEATAPPLRFRITDEEKWYVAKKKSVTIRHVSEHRLIAVLEILSPGKKASRRELDRFVNKAGELLGAGIHVSVVDLFPPSPRDPHGIHPLVWGDDDTPPFPFDPAKPLTCAAYRAGPLREAFVEPVAVGDSLPELPIFLADSEFVSVLLEETYEAALNDVPEVWRSELTAP
jgi:hypothetical protein